MITTDDIRTLVDDLSTQPATARAELRELAASLPREFARAAAPLLRGATATPAGNHLIQLAASSGLLPEMLCNPAVLWLDEARAAARELAAIDPELDSTLATWLFETNRVENEDLDPAVTQRCLDLLDAISDGARILPHLIQLLRPNHPHVQSKAAAVIARNSSNLSWFLGLLATADARVCANALEALWQRGGKLPRDVFEEAIKSPNHRVSATALVGLYRVGEAAQAAPRLRLMAAAEDPLQRAAAAWAMGEIGELSFRDVLRGMTHDPQGSVRRNAVRSLVRIRRRERPAS